MALTDKLTAIADAVRRKTGGQASLTLEEIAAAIEGLNVGVTPSGTLNVTENGTYDVSEKASVSVSVPTKICGSSAASGIDTRSANTTTSQAVNYAHGLGRVPECALIWLITPNGSSNRLLAAFWRKGATNPVLLRGTKWGEGMYVNITNTYGTFTADEQNIVYTPAAATSWMRSGDSYGWAAW